MKRIFLLEDDKEIARLYKKRLELEGYLVETCETIKEAEEKIKELDFDLALIDHGITGDEKVGLSLVSKIKKINLKAKIIILSNYSHKELRDRAEREGVDDFLVKINYTPKKLASYLEKLNW